MRNPNALWLSEHQKKLETLILENKQFPEISQIFNEEFGKIFGDSVIKEKLLKTRDHLGITGRWPIEDLKKMADLIKQNTSVEEIKRIFNSRYSKRSIQRKYALLNENRERIDEFLSELPPDSVQTKIPELISTDSKSSSLASVRKDARKKSKNIREEENFRFQTLFDQNAPLDDFYKAFPNRSTDAVQSWIYRTKKRILKNNQPAVSKTDLLSITIDWLRFAVKGFWRLSAEQWPLKNFKSESQKSALYLVSRAFLSPVEKGAINLRRLIVEAEREGLGGVRFYFAENREDYENNLLRKKSAPRIKRKFPIINNNDYYQNLVYASMLADGFLDGSIDKFQLEQAATLAVIGDHSHLEYLLTIFLKFPDNILTAAPLDLNSGLRYKQVSTTAYAWKIRFYLYNFESFSKIYKETYYQSPTKTLEEENALKKLAAKIMELSGSMPKSVENVLKFPMFFIEKTNARNYKNLPVTPILLRDYFKDPGLTIAHIHMQDGKKLNNSTLVLFIQTGYFDRACRLAICIFEKTRLRYFPKIYYDKQTNKPEVFLQLCEEDNAKFVKLTAPHFVKCMEYKIPLVRDASSLTESEKKVRKQHIAAFNYLYNTFVDTTLF
jgi:hypothetical protein